MFGRRHQVALALTALLTAAAACQNQERTEPSATAHPAPAAARGFTLVASGDILPHSSVLERANYDAGGNGYDFRPMLAAAQPAVARADLALCHLQTLSAQPALTPPPQLVRDLAAAGYDGCSTASDGSLDDGIQAALSAMDQAGLRHAGTARSEEEARTVPLLKAGPAKVAHLSYPEDADERQMIADARTARRAGADVVVVSVRWGTAWQDAPDQRQVALAQDLTASKSGGRPDIDLILGTHTQVPQAYEKVNGTWVVYGLGDQIAGETSNASGARDSRGDESTLARFTFAAPARPGGRWEVTRAEYLPQTYDVDAGRVVDLGQAIAGGAELTAARDRVRDVVLSRGAAGSGLVAGQ
ncbi:CapA family protein [Streptomyces sp. NPDC005573]|uniref:CapA family protein n=1 Tax=unclassified Streptomyces TaxID=2593676 RepID=UPI0033AE7D30